MKVKLKSAALFEKIKSLRTDDKNSYYWPGTSNLPEFIEIEIESVEPTPIEDKSKNWKSSPCNISSHSFCNFYYRGYECTCICHSKAAKEIEELQSTSLNTYSSLYALSEVRVVLNQVIRAVNRLTK